MSNDPGTFAARAAAARGSQKRAPYPAELRREALRYLETVLQRGGSTIDVARDLGIDDSTLQVWRRSARQDRPARVVLKPEPAANAHHSITVHGPMSLRIEGLSVEQVAALVRALT